MDLYNRKSHVVPELRVAFQRVRHLFKAPKGLLQLFSRVPIFVQTYAHVEKNLNSTLAIQVSDMFVN
jgi:hypothetical protein